MNRKAQFDIARKTLYWGISGFILSILIVGLVILITTFKASAIEFNPKLEATVISQRFINNPGCFAYQDPLTERVHPRLMDIDRFTQDTLDNCYQSNTTRDYQFQLTIRNLETNQEITIQTQEWFNVPSFTLVEPVTIKQGNADAQLIMKVQRRI